MVGDIEEGEGIDVLRVGVFISFGEFRKREHRQIFGLMIFGWAPIIHICQPPQFYWRAPPDELLGILGKSKLVRIYSAISIKVGGKKQAKLHENFK